MKDVNRCQVAVNSLYRDTVTTIKQRGFWRDSDRHCVHIVTVVLFIFSMQRIVQVCRNKPDSLGGQIVSGL